ncbi:SDR family NAD(P)-dependent oxidoreductase [Solwaraspora sp. WMMD1047]|uniref:SDR family oxidoreductase n=1 Tax=Solwaraspora sp. WMMD1047 TaxID=3016102 RepID=UPI0024162540|nr:SDR family oxidoreductase [Solwaraspora sp. WMMD1047]MDG4831701.1 SDR family NAD(P)-dependent oxidoreductase [Solwaraspora sp. WMMD1047]
MENSLAGTWSLILGASAGMGRSCALALAEAGSNIVGVHFDTASRQSAVDELIDQIRAHGVQAHFFNDNAASDTVRARVVEEMVKLVGPDGVRVMLHSLAFGSLVRFLPEPGGSGPVVSRKQMTMTLDVMAHSLVYWFQDLLTAGLLPSGSKVFAMTSAGTARISATYGPVSAAKSALESHVRQLAVEAAPYGIAVNAIRAGITLTESFLRIPESTELGERARQGNPHGRLTTPDDVAEALVLLARARPSWLTGNVIGVDGGEILTV